MERLTDDELRDLSRFIEDSMRVFDEAPILSSLLGNYLRSALAFLKLTKGMKAIWKRISRERDINSVNSFEKRLAELISEVNRFDTQYINKNLREIQRELADEGHLNVVNSIAKNIDEWLEQVSAILVDLNEKVRKWKEDYQGRIVDVRV
jgi:hypothetical protein